MSWNHTILQEGSWHNKMQKPKISTVHEHWTNYSFCSNHRIYRVSFGIITGQGGLRYPSRCKWKSTAGLPGRFTSGRRKEEQKIGARNVNCSHRILKTWIQDSDALGPHLSQAHPGTCVYPRARRVFCEANPAHLAPSFNRRWCLSARLPHLHFPAR